MLRVASVVYWLFPCVAHGIDVEHYSTNAICHENYCINPVLPALDDLDRLSTLEWVCQSNADVKPYLKFCADVVDYDIAVPPANSEVTLETLVVDQDNNASSMFFYHLAGMSLEAWEFKNASESNNKCVQSIQEIACNTYFPKGAEGCTPGTASTYLRPCKSVCQEMIRSCDVDCCDESVQCMFNHTVSLLEGETVTQRGYVDADAPSAICTGSAAKPSASPSALLFFLGLPLLGPLSSGVMQVVQGFGRRGLLSLSLLVVVISLQGCSNEHVIPEWRDYPSYLVSFAYYPPKSTTPMLNSCDVPGLKDEEYCSGHGTCVIWRPDAVEPMRFCQCYRDYADPECRTRRKSQATTFLLSLFAGFFGMDRFYIGQIVVGCLKLSTLGGFGLWWVLDIVHFGSAPVYANDYRLAYDLPHWVYVYCTVFFFSMFGLVLFTVVASQLRQRRKVSRMLLDAEDEFHKTRNATLIMNPQDNMGMPGYASQGAPVPVFSQARYGSVSPSREAQAGVNNPFSAYAIYNNALRAREAGNARF